MHGRLSISEWVKKQDKLVLVLANNLKQANRQHAVQPMSHRPETNLTHCRSKQRCSVTVRVSLIPSSRTNHFHSCTAGNILGLHGSAGMRIFGSMLLPKYEGMRFKAWGYTSRQCSALQLLGPAHLQVKGRAGAPPGTAQHSSTAAQQGSV